MTNLKSLAACPPRVDVAKIPAADALDWCRTIFRAMQTPESLAYLAKRAEEERRRPSPQEP